MPDKDKIFNLTKDKVTHIISIDNNKIQTNV